MLSKLANLKYYLSLALLTIILFVGQVYLKKVIDLQ